MQTSVKNTILFLKVGEVSIIPPNKDRVALIINAPFGAFCRFNIGASPVGGNGIAIYDQDPSLILTFEHFGTAIRNELQFTPSVDVTVSVMEFTIDRGSLEDLTEFDDG